ncbi:YigZ family protein [Actinobacillus seminis]|uniref:YigZ family protein n=1 Tax=Actinobacillus seminis TaxID=722 RepID=UPI0023519D76|nr:YigZ family protein [Actinobacillus seminis]
MKKSRFMTYLRHTQGLSQAKAFWEQVRALHPQARHHCWAAVAERPTNSQALGFSDDGEPAGTAGKPMLNALLGSGIGEISAVVVRYYGGILLGTGGLVRAYGNGVQQALALLETQLKIERQFYALVCDYTQVKNILTLCERHDVVVESQDFQEKVRFVLGISGDTLVSFTQDLTERSAGQLRLTLIE